MNRKDTLTQNHILWILFGATILLTVSFQVVANIWELTLIDAISDPTEARLAISSMSPHQHTIHAWVTSTLDVAYPFVYGAFFIGSCHKFYEEWAWALAAPIYLLIPTDLIEGVVQVLALTSTADWLDAKSILTPLKTMLFLFGLSTTVTGWVMWLAQRLRSS